MKLIIGCIMSILVLLAFVRIADAHSTKGFSDGYKLGYAAGSIGKGE